jgi:TolA-binding protein
MAMKDWSIGKILGVMAGGFFAVLVITLITVNVIKAHRATNTSTMANVVPDATPVPQPTGGTVRAHSDGLLDDQVDQLGEKLDNLRQQVAQQSQQSQQTNQSIMQNFNTVENQVKSIADRVNALEHPNTGPVQIVKPTEKPRVPETKRLARVSKSVPKRSGYQTEAVVGDRAWLRVNGTEATRAVGEDLPQASQPERIEAMSADSGIYVTPANSH